MNWKIIADGSRLTSGVQVEMEDEYLPIVAFFAELRPSKYPVLIASLLAHTPVTTEMSGIKFFENLDAEDEIDGLQFDHNEMQVWNHEFGDNIVPTSTFVEIAVAFLNKFIDLHAGKPSQPSELILAIQTELPLLSNMRA